MTTVRTMPRGVQGVGMGEITRRNKELHDHTDETPRCDCGRFLPKEQGHNRRMCECGTPNTYYVKDE